MLKLEKLFEQHISNLEFVKEAFTLMNGMFFFDTLLLLLVNNYIGSKGNSKVIYCVVADNVGGMVHAQSLYEISLCTLSLALCMRLAHAMIGAFS